MMVQEYDFDIEHVSGEENIIADAFSRLVDAKDLDKETIALLIRAKVQKGERIQVIRRTIQPDQIQFPQRQS